MNKDQENQEKCIIEEHLERLTFVDQRCNDLLILISKIDYVINGLSKPP